MTLDTATSELLARLADQPDRKPIHQSTPEAARAQNAVLRQLYPPGPEMVRVEDHRIGDGDAHFDVRLLIPNTSPAAVLVYYHGGGWVIGDLPGFDTLGRILAHRTGCAVVLVDYRLAPEHRYPAAAEDAWTALRWVDENLHHIAGRRVPLMVAGDSAGGNLAAVTTLRARDAGGPDIALQLLVYPVTDYNPDTASYRDPGNQLLLSRASMEWFWDHYAPDKADRTRPDAAPLRADDLSGLPPTEVLTAEHDVLRDEGEAYAARLVEAEVPTGLRRFSGQMHGFFTLPGLLPGSAAGIDHFAEAITKRLAELSH
ncbi:alpha/beta hydrolase [Streptomyces albipurpureus]|uniref:Alpha/beta hydrolase n=1 Tax=Streptomyces albipurpureus TaxID=2897419 RepID=A0ABT0V0Y0_9ACTN|nr:alpha/beta hydrolase [Streptomyces sp. CWNU-1]MCM2393218.1 alpha/beta hydrolase [Streptomyces sp. CWNU-1]